MRYVEQRVIIPEQLKRFCKEHELFTKGSKEEFDDLLQRLTDEIGCPKHMDSEAIANLAVDILEKSTWKPYTEMSLMSALVKLSYTTFEAA